MNKALFLGFTILLTGHLEAEPLAVGQSIPDTTLQTEAGKPVKLRELISKKPTVLIFYRGGWCPYCTRHLMALAGIEKDILAAGYQILAVSPDQPSKLAETPDREALHYTLLSDSSMETAKAFGLSFQVPEELVSKYKSEYQIDIEAAAGEKHHLLPHPAVFVIGADGSIRFAHVNEDYKVRLEPAQILMAVKKDQGIDRESD
jgi:peroxiredoxin